MSISTVDDVASGILNSRQRSRFEKQITAAKTTAAFQSGWISSGFPLTGAAPPAYNAGAGYTADKSTAGALVYRNAVTQNYLARLAVAGGTSVAQGTLFLADRLWHCSGMGFAAATYTVTTPGALPARITDNGLQAELWCEQFVAAGAASGTLVASYLDSAGGSQTGTLAAVVSAPVIGEMQQVPLANNLGVKQLTSVVTNATWTSGTFGMSIIQTLCEVPIFIPNGVPQQLDWAQLGLTTVPNDACLFLYWMPNTTNATTFCGWVDIIDQ